MEYLVYFTVNPGMLVKVRPWDVNNKLYKCKYLFSFFKEDLKKKEISDNVD